MDDKNRPLVIGINGSPRKNGWSAKNLEKALKFAEKFGAKTRLIHLVDLKMALCEGCYSDNPKKCTYPCVHDDDTRALHELMLKADGLIFSVPVWWAGVGPLAENFIAKLACLETNFRLKGKKKKAAFIVNCGMHGAQAVAERLTSIFLRVGFTIPPMFGFALTNMVSNTLSKNKIAEEIIFKASSFFYSEIDGTTQDLENLAKALIDY